MCLFMIAAPVLFMVLFFAGAATGIWGLEVAGAAILLIWFAIGTSLDD